MRLIIWALISILIIGCSHPTPSCNSNEVLGTDNQCYSCTYGTPELAGSTFGYCGSFNSGGVACCNSTWWNYSNITCYTSKPWLCSDGLCHTANVGVCAYVP